jgi:hypothetical protein
MTVLRLCIATARQVRDRCDERLTVPDEGDKEGLIINGRAGGRRVEPFSPQKI